MLEIFIIADCPYKVMLHGTNEIIEATDERLQPGHNEINLPLLNVHLRLSFADVEIGIIFTTDEPCAIRTLSHTRTGRDEEDGRCVITGVINPDADIDHWPGFEAADISLQIHQHFDGFRFSINVDDNYKIISFDSGIERVEGRTLDTICRAPNDERSVKHELLRWHFRQAPIFEFNFPPGTDIVGDILRGRKSAQRMEAEHFAIMAYSMNDEDNIDEISH
ncbi:hypothetical protein V1504DRAFT_441052 [Lipomyces starkeyi]